MTLYDDLGIAADADPAAIKAAHRRGVKRHHPDKAGGDRDAFEKVQRAFVVLSDPDRRARYDRDGETEQKPDDRAEKILGLAIAAFIGAMNGEGRDLIRDATALIDHQLNQAEAGARQSEADADRMTNARKRLKLRADGDDFLGTVLQQRIEAAKKNALRIRDEMQLLVEAQKRLAGYSFEPTDERRSDDREFARMIQMAMPHGRYTNPRGFRFE